MVARVERAGFRAIELTRAYEQAAAYPKDKWLPKAASFLTPPAVADQIRFLIGAAQPDLIAVDADVPGRPGRGGAVRRSLTRGAGRHP